MDIQGNPPSHASADESASASSKRPAAHQLLFEPNISINGLIDDNTVSFFLAGSKSCARAAKTSSWN